MLTTNSTGFRYIFGYTQFFYQSVLYNPNNFTNPLKKELGMLQSISDAFHFYHYRPYFSLTTSERDDNIFFSDVMPTKYFGLTQFQYGFLSYDPIDYQNQYIIQLDIFLEHYHEVYCRKYKKIQEVMAEISGFGSIALVVINFIFLIVKNEIVTSMISTDYYGELSLKKEHLTNSDIIKMANTGKINISSFNNNNTVDYLNKDSSGVNNKVTIFSQQLSLKKIIITPKNLNFQKNDKMFIYQKETK